ncbi:sulfatase family protein [Nocardioides okcheonensis]|uniref:sulfatase family protein n=1 Tax=Nocardioides okcheonensis TaxID=2894081 RepID=UPI001E32BD0A|nr:sulfatase [Nocardioides okcheonensis]UFN45093.1 sulfatase [Nocardioides okcheonensis]
MRAWAQSITAALLVVLVATLATVSLADDGGSATGSGSVRMAQGTQSPSAGGGPTRPNLVFVLTDDMRDDDLAAMPITRRLLADEGMEFTDAISPHPLCCPARAQLATGQYAQNNGVQHNRGVHGGFQALDPTREASSWFRDSGYRTGFVGKFLNGYGPHDVRPSGWTSWDALTRGVYDYVNFSMTGDGAPQRYTDSYITSVIEDHANRDVRDFARSGDPFVVYAWHLAPHYRITPEGGRGLPPAMPQDRGLYRDARPTSFDSPSFDEADVSDQPQYLRHLAPADADEVRAENSARLESLQAVDRAVGSLVQTLDDEGVLDDTYIIFSSDNGYSLGEHRYVGKDVLTDEALQVPLLVRGPGIAPGTTSDLPVTLVDLPATFADLTGVSPRWQVDGTSVADTLLGGQQAFRDTTLIQTGRTLGDGWSHRGVRTDRYLYGTDGVDAFLYDLQDDPDEMVNLVDDPAYAGVREALEMRRSELVDCAGWTCNQVFGPVPEPVLERRRGPGRRPPS